MSDIVSRRFNDLPYAHRRIASAVIIETQINQIRIDQEKAKATHRRFMKETNEHISNLENSLLKLEETLATEGQATTQ